MDALFVVPEGLYMAREQPSVDYRAIWMESEVENLCTDGDVWHLDERAIVGSGPEEGAEKCGSAHSNASTAADFVALCGLRYAASRYNFSSCD